METEGITSEASEETGNLAARVLAAAAERKAAPDKQPGRLSRYAYQKYLKHRYPGDHDKRTRGGQRVSKLVKVFAAALGNHLTERQLIAVHRAAGLLALAEDVRTRRISGDTSFSIDEVLRLDHAVTTALRALGLHDIEPPAEPEQKSLGSLLRAEQERARS